MWFDDGREIVATLLCASKDMDGSKHVIYEQVESFLGAGDPGATGCLYANANTMVSIELHDATKIARTVHGWDFVDMRRSA
jgi:tRNA U55 pseudouridine synthase TruB